MKSIVYLAAPLSHPERWVMDFRERMATEAAAYLVATTGLTVLSPLTNSCPISRAMDSLYGCKHGPMGFLSQDFWVQQFDRDLLEACSTLAILRLEGWDYSQGIKTEIEIAKDKDIEIVYLFPTIIGGHIARLQYPV